MREFNLRGTCNSFKKSLASEIGDSISLKFSIDVQVTSLLWGDPEFVFETIKLVIHFFKSKLKRGAVVIEFLKSNQVHESIELTINIMGFGKHPLPQVSSSDQHWLLNLPVAIPQDLSSKNTSLSFEVHHDHYLFSFKTTYYSSSVDGNETASIKNKRVLLIEYKDINAMVFSSFLKEWGVKVKHTKEVDTALRLINTSMFDLIFVDLYLPYQKGFEAIHKIRRLGLTIPIVALTYALMKNDNLMQGLDVVDDYLERPVNSGQLRNILMKHLR